MPGTIASWLRRNRLLLVLVVLPVMLAVLYLFVLAADRYESEAQFVVRSPRSSVLGEIDGLLKGSSMASAADDAHIVIAFIRSMDAVEVLLAEADLLAVMGRSWRDVLWRYPRPLQRLSRVGIRRQLERLIAVEFDSTSGITRLKVQAFLPRDAQRVGEVLLAHAERRVIALSDRSGNDAVALAAKQAELARQRANEVHQRLGEFRRRNAVIDPSAVSVAVQANITQLSLEKAMASAQLDELSRAARQSPQVGVLQSRIAALDQQIEEERQSLAGGEARLAALIAEHENLILERELAERIYASNVHAFELARLDTQRQRLYLEQISRPTLPDKASYPQRLLYLLGILALALAAHAVVARLADDVRRHGGH